MQNTCQTLQLGQIPVSSFLRDFQFRDLILRKLDDLNRADAKHQRLEGAVRVLLDMIEESRQGRYNGMPLILFAHAVVELERFVRIQDENPDTRVDGYADDHTRMMELHEQYRSEIAAFLSWRKARFSDYLSRSPERVDVASYGVMVAAV